MWAPANICATLGNESYWKKKPRRGGPNKKSVGIVSQSLAKVIVHIIYSTKNREPWLKNPKIFSELYALNATILKNDVDVDSPAILINGVEDHIHILCQLSRKIPIMNVVKASKTETSK